MCDVLDLFRVFINLIFLMKPFFYPKICINSTTAVCTRCGRVLNPMQNLFNDELSIKVDNFFVTFSVLMFLPPFLPTYTFLSFCRLTLSWSTSILILFHSLLGFLFIKRHLYCRSTFFFFFLFFNCRLQVSTWLLASLQTTVSVSIPDDYTSVHHHLSLSLSL